MRAEAPAGPGSRSRTLCRARAAPGRTGRREGGSGPRAAQRRAEPVCPRALLPPAAPRLPPARLGESGGVVLWDPSPGGSNPGT